MGGQFDWGPSARPRRDGWSARRLAVAVVALVAVGAVGGTIVGLVLRDDDSGEAPATASTETTASPRRAGGDSAAAGGTPERESSDKAPHRGATGQGPSGTDGSNVDSTAPGSTAPGSTVPTPATLGAPATFAPPNPRIEQAYSAAFRAECDRIWSHAGPDGRLSDADDLESGVSYTVDDCLAELDPSDWGFYETVAAATEGGTTEARYAAQSMTVGDRLQATGGEPIVDLSD